MLWRHCRDQKQRRHILVSTFRLFILDLEDFQGVEEGQMSWVICACPPASAVALKAGGLDCISNIELDSYPRVS